MASEDENRTSSEKIILPLNERTGKQSEWPTPRNPERKGGM